MGKKILPAPPKGGLHRLASSIPTLRYQRSSKCKLKGWTSNSPTLTSIKCTIQLILWQSASAWNDSTIRGYYMQVDIVSNTGFLCSPLANMVKRNQSNRNGARILLRLPPMVLKGPWCPWRAFSIFVALPIPWAQFQVDWVIISFRICMKRHLPLTCKQLSCQG